MLFTVYYAFRFRPALWFNSRQKKFLCQLRYFRMPRLESFCQQDYNLDYGSEGTQNFERLS